MAGTGLNGHYAPAVQPDQMPDVCPGPAKLQMAAAPDILELPA